MQQIIDGNTTDYLYDDANRLAQVDGQSYTFDDNGNLLSTGVMTNVFDAANRLVETSRSGTTIQPIYNGVNDRVGQTVGVSTTNYALDIAGGLPEVIYTSEGNVYLHLPGVIVTEKASEVRYLLSDGLGSIRQAVDENGAVVAYNEFDPYGNPVESDSQPYGFTGEWWEDEVGLLHLRARWYSPGTGTFLSRDPWEGSIRQPHTLNSWSYIQGNPVNFTDPVGLFKCNPLTGVCDNGYGLCVVQGQWQGAYVNGKPCIANPGNVQTGSPPALLPLTSRPTLLSDMPPLRFFGPPRPELASLHECYCTYQDRAILNLVQTGYPTTFGIIFPTIGGTVGMGGGYEGGVSNAIVFNWYSLEVGILPAYSIYDMKVGLPEGGAISSEFGLFFGHGGTNLEIFGGPAETYYGEIAKDTLAQVGGSVEIGLGINDDGSYVFDPLSGVPVWYETVNLTVGQNLVKNLVDAKVGINPGIDPTRPETTFLLGQPVPGQYTNYTFPMAYPLDELGLVGTRKHCPIPPGGYRPPFVPSLIYNWEIETMKWLGWGN